MNIVEAIADVGRFNLFSAALDLTGLADTLKGEGPFTVFVPTDEALERLPRQELGALLRLGDRDRLAAILSCHVVPHRMTAQDLAEAGGLCTALGQEVEAEVSADGLRLGGARVIVSDIAASNGVIHVIDALLIPAPA